VLFGCLIKSFITRWNAKISKAATLAKGPPKKKHEKNKKPNLQAMHQSPQKINLPRYQLRASGATSGTASGFDLGFFNIQRGVFARWLNQPI